MSYTAVAPWVLIVNIVDGVQRVADRLRADGLKVSAAIAVEEVFSVLERLTPSAIIVDVPLAAAAPLSLSFNKSGRPCLVDARHPPPYNESWGRRGGPTLPAGVSGE